MLVSDTGKSKVNRLYIATLFANMFALISDIVCWSFEGNPQAYAAPIIRLSNFTTYILEYILGMVYNEYVIAYISTKNKISKKFSYTLYAIYGVATVLVIISQFNGMYYYFDAENNFYRGPLNWLSYTLPGICLVI
jgi:membrane protein YqaA with SNARE-associated domain